MSGSDFVDILRNNHLFSALPEEIVIELAGSLELLTFRLGETILKKNDPGDGFFIVYKGKVRVVDDTVDGKPITLAVLREGQGFGESSLFFNQPVSATVRSAAKLVLLKLSSEKFQSLVNRRPEIGEKIKSVQTKQAEFNFLKSQKLISGLSPEKIQELISKIKLEDIELSDKLGIRAQLFDENKMLLVDDFICINDDSSTHVLNAVSPAFTSSFALADLIINTSKVTSKE